MRVRLSTAAVSDPGRIRAYNDDSLAADAELGALVLADGMGGHNAGDVAARMATALVLEHLASATSRRDAPEPRIRAAMSHANAAIVRAARADAAKSGMGATVVVALFGEGRVTIGHVGDSRAYRLRGGRLKLLTRDHTILQQQAETGLVDREGARVSRNRSLVTRALGAEAQAEVLETDVKPEDLILLCSDGLNDMVDDADIELALAELGCNLDFAAETLVEMANDNGGQDNISVLLARADPEPPVRAGWPQRLFGWLRS
ncbi:MAG: protein phosphatase 2C domain-containing protein [Burkholderiales bacterium]|nr:protein phosphatase 2C domain-containing protein [Burkholderiales bacterium]